jgi:hypothetical protein
MKYKVAALLMVLVMAAVGCIDMINRLEDSQAESVTESSAAESAAESTAEQSSAGEQSTTGTGDAEVDEKMQFVQGEWFDVNGDARLVISGDQLTLHFGKNFEESFAVKAEKQGDWWFLVNKEGRDLGFISDIQIKDDGSLIAYEMILDADGHDYHFVREEQIAAEKEIVDLSKDMPKQIESKEIRRFILNFSTKAGRGYGLDDSWRGASYSWTIEKQSDGSYVMDFDQSYDSYMGINFHDTVSAEYVAGLAEQIVELGLPDLNGYYQKNNVDLPGYYLYVKYESNEKLEIRAEGNAADTCVFDLAKLMEYVFPMVAQED